MNIFILSQNPVEAAQLQCDKHVVKMVLETAQILCTVRVRRGLDSPYRPTHINHPCVLWAYDPVNFNWLVQHFRALLEEYTLRYGRQHKCGLLLPLFPSNDLPPPDSFVQCMPDDCRGVDPVEAYQEYYRKHKREFARWTIREIPDWMEN